MSVALLTTPLSKALADDLAAVASLGVIPKILDVICRTTGLGFSAVVRVTEDRWIACAVRDEIAFGLVPGGELPVGSTICNEIRDTRQAVVIDHVAKDPEYRDHPTPKLYGFQSYISVPILRADGRFFGTLCAIDPRPAQLSSPETLQMFQLFADLIGLQLTSGERLAASDAALMEAHHVAELREQFVAVLGHDLRNPLAAIDINALLLLKTATLGEPATKILLGMRTSAARMAGLIDNMLDFARGRLGSGMEMQRVEDCDLTVALEQVLWELQALYPDRLIAGQFHHGAAVRCDSARIAQLLSNLLANALHHGDPAKPVWVRANSDTQGFELSVTNEGAPIPADDLARLFQPFARGSAPGDSKGLGLGLYIAAEIARGHDGTLTVASTAAETRFTFRMRG